MQVKEWDGDVVFLHTVGQGAADRSYGIHVARLAGLPKTVINRADDILNQLEANKASGNVTSSTIGDLPLFQTLPNTQTEPAQVISTEPSASDEYLETVNPDSLSPREAMEILYHLKSLHTNA